MRIQQRVNVSVSLPILDSVDVHNPSSNVYGCLSVTFSVFLDIHVGCLVRFDYLDQLHKILWL